ncbi:MAG: zinc ribbon domain-containing protein [Clostridia bacterium]
MFCPNCGTKIEDQATVCPSCGTSLSAFQQGQNANVENLNNQQFNNQNNQQYNNQNFQQNQQNQQQKNENLDSAESTVGWGFLGFFIPLAGLILFCIWQKDFPKRAKSAGIGALVSVILWIVLGVILGLVLPMLLAAAIANDPTLGLSMLASLFI